MGRLDGKIHSIHCWGWSWFQTNPKGKESFVDSFAVSYNLRKNRYENTPIMRRLFSSINKRLVTATWTNDQHQVDWTQKGKKGANNTVCHCNGKVHKSCAKIWRHFGTTGLQGLFVRSFVRSFVYTFSVHLLPVRRFIVGVFVVRLLPPPPLPSAARLLC